MVQECKHTVLFERHIASSANMGVFTGYTMPLWYPSGMRREHLTVLQGAGIFDTSHMALLSVDGTGARSLLQHCFSNDLETCLGPRARPLKDGR